MRTKHAALFICCVGLVLVSLPACGPQLQRPTVSQGLIEQERGKQEQMALRLRVERKFQLVNVLERLRFHGRDWCKDGCPVAAELIDEDKVNAFTNGVKIGITTGMIRFVKNDDELALVLGHELAHGALNHLGKQAGNVLLGTLIGAALDLGLAVAGANTGGTGTRLGQDLGRLVFSQEFEMEADYLGLQVAARAGFDISKAADFYRRMGVEHPGSIRGNFLATHPGSSERTVAIEAAAREIQSKLPPEIGKQPTELAREDPGSKSSVEARRLTTKTEPAQKTEQQETKRESTRKHGQPLEEKNRETVIATTKTAPPDKMLYVTRGGAKLYAKQWDYSSVLTKLEQGEALMLLGRAFGTEDSLYKVKTRKGVVGWVSATDVSAKP